MRSRFPNPTNAQAVAALDALVPQSDAPAAIARGWNVDVASSWLLPDGILPRMRLLAWGWTKPGDRFKSPSDRAWWGKRYQYPLWNPIETYVDQAERQDGTDSSGFVGWDDDLAAGDEAELSRSMPAVVHDDLPAAMAKPCPEWLIPPGRGMAPIPNPSCLKGPIRDIGKKIIPILAPGISVPWWAWGIAILLITRRRR